MLLLQPSAFLKRAETSGRNINDGHRGAVDVLSKNSSSEGARNRSSFHVVRQNFPVAVHFSFYMANISCGMFRETTENFSFRGFFLKRHLCVAHEHKFSGHCCDFIELKISRSTIDLLICYRDHKFARKFIRVVIFYCLTTR